MRLRISTHLNAFWLSVRNTTFRMPPRGRDMIGIAVEVSSHSRIRGSPFVVGRNRGVYPRPGRARIHLPPRRPTPQRPGMHPLRPIQTDRVRSDGIRGPGAQINAAQASRGELGYPGTYGATFGRIASCGKRSIGRSGMTSTPLEQGSWSKSPVRRYTVLRVQLGRR